MREAPETSAKSVFVLGASGGVGRQIVAQALARGHAVTAQTRDAGKLEDLNDAVQGISLEPTDTKALETALTGHDAVIFALGVKRLKTTLFSDATRALLPAMKTAGLRRLIAITGVGAGETKGHGGFVYDRLIFPYITKHIYADKTVQEDLIEASDLDWAIVRPAPFSEKQSADKLLAITRIKADTKLRRITKSEVATFVLNQMESDMYLHAKVFIGHP